MAKYRDQLPSLSDQLFLTDSGLETTLIFLDGYELPEFASFVLLDDPDGRERLLRYYREHAEIAARVGAGFVLESVSWRANRDWGTQIGYTPEMLDRVNRDAIELLVGLRDELEASERPMMISGCIGPQDDGYHPDRTMSEDEAEEYHGAQIETLGTTEADMVSALTITYPAEAIGIVRSARANGLPVVISFTVETDGSLPSGVKLGDAINAVDAATDSATAYFMINCAHPTHFESVLSPGESWVDRVRGFRANSSRLSHAELDDAEELDAGDPHELATQYAELRDRLPHFNVFGGCCGTDLRHVDEIADALTAAR